MSKSVDAISTLVEAGIRLSGTIAAYFIWPCNKNDVSKPVFVLRKCPSWFVFPGQCDEKSEHKEDCSSANACGD